MKCEKCGTKLIELKALDRNLCPNCVPALKEEIANGNIIVGAAGICLDKEIDISRISKELSLNENVKTNPQETSHDSKTITGYH